MIAMPINARILATAFLTMLVAGCLPHEGVYLPGCAAYVGDKITLGDGQFVWEKFTDERSVDDEGNIVNPFPGYPLQGSYRLDGQFVQMNSDSGEALDAMYLHRVDGQHYILTATQKSAFDNTGSLAECALQLKPETAN